MFLLQCNVLFVESINTINHALDKFNFRVAKTMFVGDIICAASLATRFSSGSTRLNLELFTSLLQKFYAFLGPARKVNVDRSPHSSPQVGGAGVDVTIFGI